MSDNPVRSETELVTIDEMAARMAMTRTTFERLVRIHTIPKVRLGHEIVRFPPESVSAYVTELTTP